MPVVIHGERLQLRSVCTPDLGDSTLAKSAARLGYKKQGGESTVLWCEHRKDPLGSIYREEYGIIPEPGFPALLHATDWLKGYGHGHGLEVLR